MALSDPSGRLPGVLVAIAAGLLGATLVQRNPEPCACRGDFRPVVTVLPEIEVVADRLP